MDRPKKLKYRPPSDSTWPAQDEIELLRDLCRTDFWTFFLYAFGAGVNPKGDKWIDEEVHYPLAQWFQKHVDEWFDARAQGKVIQKHLAIVIPRELGKTTISQALQLWIQVRDPEVSIYTGSERTELSQKIIGGIKAVMDGSDPYALFTKLYGNWASQARSWTGKEITHAARKNTARKDPSLGTFAVETSIVGAHPDVWVHDDPISYERMTSDTNWLQTVNSQVTSMVPVVQADGLVVWVGTRYDDDDHFGVAFRDEGVASLEGMPTDSIVVEDTGKWHVYFLAARNKEGVPIAPKVWPEKRLKDYQRRDPLRYAAQVLNDPAVSEFNPITREQIQECKVKASEVPWGSLRFAICFDTAFAHGERRVGKDETVFIIHGYPRSGSGDVFVCEVHGSPLWRAEDFCKNLVVAVQRYRAQGRRVFALAGDFFASGGRAGTLELAMRNFFHDVNQPMPMLYEFNRNKSGQDKTTRIVNAATFWVDGHVRWIEGAPGMDKLTEQMAKIGQMMINKKMKDDYVDAHSDAFQPELYTSMKRTAPGKAPWERGATAIAMEGLNPRMFDDDEARNWASENPREPLKQP